MEIMGDKVLQEDLQEIAANEMLNALQQNAAVLVTGATGMIGSLIVRALALHSVKTQKKLRILALVRNSEKAREMFGSLEEAGIVRICTGDITALPEIADSIDYIIHGASATNSRYFVESPVETIITALQGTRNILELAKCKQVKKMVYLSSLEVYGTPAPDQGLISETTFGHIDPMQVRSSYSEGKRMSECLCASYAKEYGVPVTVARLSQTFGAGVTYNDGRVFAEFARCAIENRNIVLHTQGRTVRSYCYTTDAINAILCLMLHGQPGEAYNVTNMDTAISIRDMAELVCTMSSGDIEVKLDIPEDVTCFGYNPEMIIKLDSRKLQALGWKPKMGLTEMFTRLIKSMKSNCI